MWRACSATRSCVRACRVRRTRTWRHARWAAFRASTGWQAPPLRLRIHKRIPVAAGLAGGSADAAAALRLARHASGLGDEQLLRTLAAQLGADVPAQISPGRWLASGAGECLHQLPDPNPESFGLLIVPKRGGSLHGGGVRGGRPAGSRSLRRVPGGSTPSAAGGARAERGGAGGARAAGQRPAARGHLAVPADRKDAQRRCARLERTWRW